MWGFDYSTDASNPIYWGIALMDLKLLIFFIAFKLEIGGEVLIDALVPF